MKIYIILLFAGLFAGLAGCGDGVTDRELTCMEHGGTPEYCMGNKLTNEYRAQPIQSPGYGPVSAGTHQNYYGDPAYGSWSDGQYHFNDPYGSQASSTNAFLLGAGVGGLTAYLATKAASRSSWERENPKGYQPETNTTKTALDKKGNPISQKEYDRRKAQSAKDKAAYKQKKADQARKKKAAEVKAIKDKQKADKRKADAAKRKAEADKARLNSQKLSKDKAARAAKKQALLDKKAARQSKPSKFSSQKSYNKPKYLFSKSKSSKSRR